MKNIICALIIISIGLNSQTGIFAQEPENELSKQELKLLKLEVTV